MTHPKATSIAKLKQAKIELLSILEEVPTEELSDTELDLMLKLGMPKMVHLIYCEDEQGHGDKDVMAIYESREDAESFIKRHSGERWNKGWFSRYRIEERMVF